MSSFQALRTQYASRLKAFTTSTKVFEVLTTIPSGPSADPETLYVLDSSFNPPTRAHLRIVSTALLENSRPRRRLLLLLAIHNADKPSKPASFEDRLAMMELFARDLRPQLASAPAFEHAVENIPLIDIGVTKKPYFIDKAAAIEASDSYPTPMEQVHLMGYDTLIRIFDLKYYPPEHNLKSLAPLFSKHRLRVTMRPSDGWGGREEQEEFLAALARGDRDSDGARREWADRIQLVEGCRPTDQPVSSTRAREASQSAPQDLEWLVPEQVRQFLLSEHLYSGNSKV
ncbi:hypothetical protein DTO013E5_8879 [Penicillium roqueforti]|nr:hypothetical protein DTO012A1_5144 [Penicillium roqueforti]KAI2742693.1 hypothetical protein DTO013F2_8453 [Penicillium roqueforti]KAI3140209.1 hypothetical protein CBS147325_6441 [Penicillium roqueforti]KAI3200800.1 hypothetical protein DTO013E5_8879 [Penicillium roqueforti]